MWFVVCPIWNYGELWSAVISSAVFHTGVRFLFLCLFFPKKNNNTLNAILSLKSIFATFRQMYPWFTSGSSVNCYTYDIYWYQSTFNSILAFIFQKSAKYNYLLKVLIVCGGGLLPQTLNSEPSLNAHIFHTEPKCFCFSCRWYRSGPVHKSSYVKCYGCLL